MKRRFKKGAASFYIVAFSTLILVVIATGFATVIMSEISRTANDDLSQSAYDSALAGIEDAKVAYSNYRRCKEAGVPTPSALTDGGIKCDDILYWVEKKPNDCAMVGHILGKIPKNDDTGEVAIGGVKKTNTDGETTTNQAYTCVIINTDLRDYRTTLNEQKKVQTLRASMGKGKHNNADKIKISWYSVSKIKGTTDPTINTSTYIGFTNNRVVFPQGIEDTTVPPIVELQIVQTGDKFNLTDFDTADSSNMRTNRATLFLVPTKNTDKRSEDGNNYIGIWNGDEASDAEKNKNIVRKEDVVKTNDHSISNKAFLAYCDPRPSTEFYCNVEIELPDVIGGTERNNDTFMISINLPYQRPNTDFSIELCSRGVCNSPIPLNEVEETSDGTGIKKITNAQIAIDSTGRANDLYRRVESRLDTADTTFGSEFPYYALEVLGNDGIKKVLEVSSEHNFDF